MKKTVYLISAIVMVATALTPYALNHVRGLGELEILGQFLAALIWLIAFCLTIRFGERGWKRWWPVGTLPVALFPVARTLFIFYCWKTRGFAP